jgi:hypothetical protein
VLQAEKIVMSHARSPSWAVSSNIINNVVNERSKKKKEEKRACLFVGPTSRRCGCGQVRSHRNNETRTKVAWNAKGGAVSAFLSLRVLEGNEELI